MGQGQASAPTVRRWGIQADPREVASILPDGSPPRELPGPAASAAPQDLLDGHSQPTWTSEQKLPGESVQPTAPQGKPVQPRVRISNLRGALEGAGTGWGASLAQGPGGRREGGGMER